MRLIFLGTPEFAVPTLERIAAAGHEVLAVVTQPDRPRGRGQVLAAPPVKEAALRLRLPVHQPEKIRNPEVTGWFASLAPEVMVVVGYGKIIPQQILDIPPRGILNVHASLLPRYRGAAPIQWAIANGETRTGVTTMRIDAGLDTGDILLQAETEIGPEETAPELSPRLAAMGAELLLETLATDPAPRKQDASLATYAPILGKQDGLIDWRRPASEIHARVRGLQPWPGGHTRFRGRSLQIWRARLAGPAPAGEPGSLHAAAGSLVVRCGSQTALELVEVQMEGKKRTSAEAFLNGYRPAENEILGEK